MPTVVGEMMPFRFGCVWSSAAVLSNDVWSSSLPYTVSTSLILGWLAARSVFIMAIHEFWFVAFALADRIAISPLSPIALATMSTSTLAMPSAVAWLMKRSRYWGSVSESKVTTLVPAFLAWVSASPMAFGSLAETTRALTCCWAAVLMYWTCASGVAV